MTTVTGYCPAAAMYVAWPCPARGCPQHEKCLTEYKRIIKEDDEE